MEELKEKHELTTFQKDTNYSKSTVNPYKKKIGINCVQIVARRAKGFLM